MIQSKNIKQMLSEDGFCISRFSGDSMKPFLNENTDELLISAIKTKPKVGDIVLFHANGCYLLHRIVSKKLFGYVTKGDNVARVDGYVPSRKILGKLEGFWRNNQYEQVYKTEYYMRIADVNVRVLGTEREKAFCKEYIVPACTTDLTLDIGIPAKIEQGIDMNTHPLAVEEYTMMTQFAYNAWKFGVLMLHSSVVLMEGKAYVFVGPSGIGKSTHAKLLRKTFGDKVAIINGDKAALRQIDGKTMVFGCPWAGKERWNQNVSAPLGGVVVLDRADLHNYDSENTTNENVGSRIEKVPAPKVFDRLVGQLIMDLKDISHLDNTLALFSDMLCDVPIYRFFAAKSEAAARLSYMTLTGKTGFEGQKQAISDKEWEISDNDES